MKIDLIYTFFEGEQQFRLLDITPPILSDEETLKAFVKAPLTDEENGLLVKVSCCVFGEGQEPEIPEWYMKANGKLWLNDHKRKQYGLD